MDNKTGYFILQGYDEDTDKYIQFHYWINNGRYFSCTIIEGDDFVVKSRRISKELYENALEEYYCA
jgi:hypothetical protein